MASPRPLRVLLLVLLTWNAAAQRIAVIGGGISGSFVTKYLTDYVSASNATNWDEIVVLDPQPVRGPISVDDDAIGHDGQGSRVTTLQLRDGSLIELGASIGYRGFHLVIDMMRQAGLQPTKPFATGQPQEDDDPNLRSGLGIFDGPGQWPLLTSQSSSFYSKLQLLYRYNWDLWQVNRLCQHAQEAFAEIPKLLADATTFAVSPAELWEQVGLSKMVQVSFDALLDHTLRKPRLKLPGQGSIRDELLTAINLVNYNQDNAHVNGIVGLGSFAASTGGLFSVEGGNCRLIPAALELAKQQVPTVRELAERVTTVVGNVDGFTLFAGDEDLGRFDLVVLAAPLQQSRIDFWVESQWDSAVLQPMPLGGLVDGDAEADEGHAVLPHPLPGSATRPYRQVTTTVLKHVTLNTTRLGIREPALPRSICSTVSGKASLSNITAISQLRAKDGLYKVFSDEPLSEETRNELFGEHHDVEYVQIWGGPHGGATPDYQGQGEATSFLLYDGANGLEGHTKAGALYYPSAMEQSSLASMELSAVGAKAVAKLIARRLGWIEAGVPEDSFRDEL